jgi:PleD family two-component response regulator
MQFWHKSALTVKVCIDVTTIFTPIRSLFHAMMGLLRKKRMSAETILLVEDNPVNQKLLLVVLQPHGYRLITAEDGEEAVSLAMREHPNLILMISAAK